LTIETLANDSRTCYNLYSLYDIYHFPHRESPGAQPGEFFLFFFLFVRRRKGGFLFIVQGFASYINYIDYPQIYQANRYTSKIKSQKFDKTASKRLT